MGVLRTYLAAALCVLTLAGPAAAIPRDPAERAQVFATCIGRLSAMMEHQWLLGESDAESTRLRRADFEALLGAVLDDARAGGMRISEVMSWRIGAKSAQARLLRMATFSPDPGRAVRARTMALRQLRICEALLPG